MYRKLTATMFGTALGLSTLAMIPGTAQANAYPWDGTDGPPEDLVQTTERYLSDGECANGKIGFSDPVADNQAMPDHITYENSLGDEVKWNLNH